MKNKMMYNGGWIAYAPGYYNQGMEYSKMNYKKKNMKCKSDDFKTAVSHTGKVEANFSDPFQCSKKGKREVRYQ